MKIGHLCFFASDRELTEFRNRLEQYRGGPPGEQINAPYAQLFSRIEEIAAIAPNDRIGRLFKQERGR